MTITATEIWTVPRGSVTGGGCAAIKLLFQFTRIGDSLAGTWNGASVRLVKRP